MAKVSFSKLQASINGKVSENSYCNKNGEAIVYEVKYYLPIKEKLELVSKVINQSMDDNGFYNPMKIKLYMTLEIVYAYTNLNFTDKMKEDPFKLYDIIISSGIFNNILESISEKDWEDIQENVWETIDNIYKYKNSVMGILETITNDYNNLNLDASEIQSKIADPDNMDLLKSILSKLG